MLRNKIQNSKIKILRFILLFHLLPTTYYLLPLGFAQEQFTYDAKGKRDPFIALVTPEGRLLELEPKVGKTELSLEGIIYDEYGISYAIVNGEIVNVSDKVGDWQVLKIQKNKVIFIKEGKTQEIELKREEE